MARQLSAMILALAVISGVGSAGPRAVQPRRITVLSFVSSDANSRSQITVLKSMREQFGSRVRFVVAPVDNENPVNLYNDWNLEGIKVAKNGPELARRYRVTAAPTTLVVSRDGVTLSRINGIADAPRLAFPLQNIFPVSSRLSYT